MKIETPLRLIKAVNIVTEEPIFFLTNISDLGTEAITEIYKSRWDIEVFFRFLKQELNLKHLMSYNENGIKIMMYMTLIAAMLVMAYKKENNLSGYKIPMMKFIQDIEGDFIKQIVAFCGGDPKKINELYPT